MKMAWPMLPALLLFLASCSRTGSFNEMSLRSQEGIIGGQEIHDRMTEASKSVVLIEMVNGSGWSLGFCTGTLIGTNTVVTAGHCFDKNRTPSLKGFNVVFTNKYSAFKNLVQRKGLRWVVHPSYNSTTEYDHDIAIASFAGSLPSGYQPVAYDKDSTTDLSGSTVYVYGYGRSEDYAGTRNEDPSAFTGQLHRGVMQIDKNFSRHPDRYWSNPQVPVFICQGDSGGPQFYHEGGVLKLIGVNSAVYGPKLPNGYHSCKGIAQATKVAAFAKWIQDTRTQLFTTESLETF